MQQDPQMSTGTDEQPTPDGTIERDVSPQGEQQPAAHAEGGHEQQRTRDTSLLGRVLGNAAIGSLIYVYFGVFVAFHVVLSVQFFLQTLHPVIGIGAWIITMVLGGLCVVALTVWREKVSTFWSDET